MAGERDNGCLKFGNLPNFRRLCEQENSGLLYRSSRPDFITEGDLETIQGLGIRCIVDFRSKSEYLRASGRKLADSVYQLCEVDTPPGRNYRPHEVVRSRVVRDRAPRRFLPFRFRGRADDDATPCISGSGSPSTSDSTSCCDQRKHFTIDFFTGTYVWTVYNRAPWYIRFYGIFLLLLDFLLNVNYVHFIRYFARNLLNKNGLIGQYRDIVDLSQRSLCAALKLLTDPNNVPALLNCAHGKDRTGIVSAMVLTCLGKSKEYIAEEYAQSNTGLREIASRAYYEIVTDYHLSEHFLHAEPETMIQLLDYICDKYGSVESYMEYIGFSAKEQTMLRENILTKQKELAFSK